MLRSSSPQLEGRGAVDATNSDPPARTTFHALLKLGNKFRRAGVVHVPLPPAPEPSGVSRAEDAAYDHDRDEQIEKRLP